MFKALILLLPALVIFAQQPTELALRGYSVIPSPRSVRLSPGDLVVDRSWSVDRGTIAANDIAVRTLLAGVHQLHAPSLAPGAPAANVIRLAIKPGAVATGAEPLIDRQAYQLKMNNGMVAVTGNAPEGLFYGVQTLLQLMKPDTAGRVSVPAGVIEDWPRLALRFLHWDAKHHQDRMKTLKRYLDWSARLKINMIGFELEDKFEYPSHPVIGAPGAFTAAQLQELVDYGLERYIQVVPVVQSPAHMAYVLKHPEFADLRADGNNYQSDVCNPKTLDLIFSMYGDVIKATRGVKYFFVSTDEVYFAAIGNTCRAPYNPVNRSLAWVDFVRRAHEFLSGQGRTMLVWAEFPLRVEHVKLLPEGIIDGVVGEASFLPIEKQRHIRQLQYVSMQGAELLFPNIFSLEGGRRPGNLETARAAFQSGRAMGGNPIGAFGAAWDDSGLHNETFWLGWSTVAQYAWNPDTAPLDQHVAEFFSLYYGPHVRGMADVYRSLQKQARGWEQTWDYIPSKTVLTRYGGYFGKGLSTHRSDMTLATPLINDLPDWFPDPFWSERYHAWLAEARRMTAENRRLQEEIQTNIQLADRNRYNLEVLLVLARFINHHWQLLLSLEQAENTLREAQSLAGEDKHAEAVSRLKAAYDIVDRIGKQRVATFNDLKSVFEKSRFPKGQSVDGRKFVHIYDDVKDHWADRRADLSFMTAPEESLALDRWNAELANVIRIYAGTNGVDVPTF
ncbi:MAG: beta-N-acetylhexosaminidase [Bryobacterales bacterium]|nr:beta-N-acetylhexosaminidase [Bryobacterales bacterium]